MLCLPHLGYRRVKYKDESGQEVLAVYKEGEHAKIEDVAG